MKLNFWQVVGIIIVVIALVFIIRREMGGEPKPSQPSAPPATVPAV